MNLYLIKLLSANTKTGSYENQKNTFLHKSQDHQLKRSASKVHEACARHQNGKESKRKASGHISDFERLASVVESFLTQSSSLQIELSYIRDDKNIRNVSFIRCKACIVNNIKRCIYCHQCVPDKHYTKSCNQYQSKSNGLVEQGSHQSRK